MDTLASGLVAALIGYLVGSLPFGFLTAKLVAGTDIRTAGSGNIGATNVGRVLGAKWGVFVLVLDGLKGLLPTLLLPWLLLPDGDPAYRHVQVGTGIAAIAGHMYPCWLGFRGGKGVATALGVVLILGWPWATLAAVGVFVAVLLVSRIVSLSSILAVTTFAVVKMVILWPAPFSEQDWSLAAFSLVVPAVIIYRHRENLRRLFRGEEPRLGAGPSRDTTKAAN